MTKTVPITQDMTIQEVLKKHPKMIEVLQDFGLYCAGCHLSAYETLEQGILGHGMDKKTLNSVLKALNEVAQDKKSIHLTKLAALKMLEMAEKEGAPTANLRVTASQKKGIWTYAMDFAKTAKKSEKKLKYPEGVTLLLGPKSLKNLGGATIDYVMTYETEGFKINTPNEKAWHKHKIS